MCFWSLNYPWNTLELPHLRYVRTHTSQYMYSYGSFQSGITIIWLNLHCSWWNICWSYTAVIQFKGFIHLFIQSHWASSNTSPATQLLASPYYATWHDLFTMTLECRSMSQISYNTSHINQQLASSFFACMWHVSRILLWTINCDIAK